MPVEGVIEKMSDDMQALYVAFPCIHCVACNKSLGRPESLPLYFVFTHPSCSTCAERTARNLGVCL